MIFFIEDVEIIWKSFIFFFSSQHFSSCFLHLCQRAFYRIFNVIPFLYISSLFTYTYLFFGIPLVIIKCILQSCIPSRVSLLPKPFSVDLCGCRNLNVVSPECGATSAHPPPLSLSAPASVLSQRWNWLKFMAFAARARKLFVEISLRDLSLILTPVHLAACRSL